MKKTNAVVVIMKSERKNRKRNFSCTEYIMLLEKHIAYSRMHLVVNQMRFTHQHILECKTPCIAMAALVQS